MGELYLDYANALASALMQVWGFYATVLVAVLGGVVLSPSLRPPQPVGRVVLVLAGLALFLGMNFFTVAANSARLNHLLGKVGEAVGADPAASYPVFAAPFDFLVARDRPFAFDTTWALVAHLVIDVFILVAVAWALLTDGERRAR